MTADSSQVQDEIAQDFFTLEAIEAEACRRSFATFVRAAWSVADPGTTLKWNTALEGICACLQAVTEGRLNDLVIAVPPGTGKSLTTSVLWPAWLWARSPGMQGIFASYELTKLVMRDSLRWKDLCTSYWYTRRFRVAAYDNGEPNWLAWEYSDSQDTKAFSKNTVGGTRIGTSVGSGTGLRADFLAVDDVLRADDAESELARESASNWFWRTMSTRFNDLSKAVRVVIMQRLHESDLAAECIAKGFEYLCLPSRFDPDRRAVVHDKQGGIIWEDPRTRPGELLFPELFPEATLKKLEADLGSAAFQAQHQQDPVSGESGRIKRQWFAPRWFADGERPVTALDGHAVLPRQAPGQYNIISVVVDAAFKATKTSDFVAIGVFGVSGPNLYLLDFVLDRLDFSNTLSTLRLVHKKWRPNEVCVEDRANGPAVMNVLKAEISGLIGIEPDGGKESRIYASAPKIEAGNVVLPLYPKFITNSIGGVANIEELISQSVKFPRGAHDDGIDMLAYAIARHLTGSQNLLTLMRLGTF